ncbi:hypothetical protein ACHAO1_010122 [Botrytis cinerea]
MAAHNRKASEHKITSLWQECLLQTSFTVKNHIDYLMVVENPDSNNKGDEIPLTQPEKDLSAKIERDSLDVIKYLHKEAGIVYDIGDSRTERVPWLHDVTKFPFHLANLKDEEIGGSYKLPSGRELDGDYTNAEGPHLVRIFTAAEALLIDAYQLCSDTSPNRKMTQQRANILNGFHAGATGKAAGFRYHKNASTLIKYFAIGKQLLPDQNLPRDIIESTSQKIRALDIEDPEVGQQALKHAIRRLYLALICHYIGNVPFKSPVLSCCAMKSRMISGQGLWEEPGNFNSHLSALTWTAQLILFGYACFQEQDNEDQIPILLTTICKKFFQQLAETPFRYILRWRLYLFKVAKAAIAKHQAWWSLDKQIVGYRGGRIVHVTNLRFSHF